MTRYRRPGDLARQTLIDATVVATLIDATVANLDLGIGGWPTQTPGASPLAGTGAQECPRPDCARTRPCPEHDGDDRGDTALRDLEHLTDSLRLVAHHVALVAMLCTRWGMAGIDQTTVTTRLATIDAGIWCQNCARHGFNTVRLSDRTECRFCADFRRDGACGLNNPNHYEAPKDLIDTHQRRRINSGDVKRIMERTYGDGWNRKRKGNGKAA